MAEAEATQDGEAPADAPSAPALDLTYIRGFQVFARRGRGGRERTGARRGNAQGSSWPRSSRRAPTRLAEAVDDALVLANDGTIRWLGDPIAKLVAGEETLKPRARHPRGRRAVRRKAARRLQRASRSGSSPTCARCSARCSRWPSPRRVPKRRARLALKLSQSLGVLERERVKAQVKALDQNARGALRKLGVRFGAFTSMFPRSSSRRRGLCARNCGRWLARTRRRRRSPSGCCISRRRDRTSFAVEPPASGERLSRRRLPPLRRSRRSRRYRRAADGSDPRRAAASDAVRRARVADEGGEGFVVTNQMTSLTGCSGEHFASILRSLGFASHKVKKSEFLAAARKAAAAGGAPPPRRRRPRRKAQWANSPKRRRIAAAGARPVEDCAPAPRRRGRANPRRAESEPCVPPKARPPADDRRQRGRGVARRRGR